MSAADLAAQIESDIRKAGRPERAASEQRYLKSELEHAGATVPAVRRIVNDELAAHGALSHDELIALIGTLSQTGACAAQDPFQFKPEMPDVPACDDWSMFGDDASNENFEEMLRTIAREVSKSVERAAEAAQVDLDEIAGAIGVDPARAREWVEGAVEWLRDQAEGLGDDMPLWGRQSQSESEPEQPTPSSAGAQRTGPHPLDLPTADQGMALAALDSGRWTVEPGSHALIDHGEGPGPSDGLGLVGELRARDWIAADGALTASGRRALSRWLESGTA